jgi:biopolymer transport protein TolR
VKRDWQPRRAAGVTPDMNVTPLVDVVLVLLIIFMVVAPHMEQDIPVTLPGIFNPDPDIEQQTPPLMLTVPKPGEFHIEGRIHDLETAVGELAAAHGANPYRRLELRADAGLKYKDVREMFNRLQQIGFPGMSILVSHRYRADQATGVAAPPAGAGSPADGSAVQSGDAASMSEQSSAAMPGASAPGETVP